MAFALSVSSGAQVAGVAPAAQARGRDASRRTDAVAARGDVRRGRSVSLSPGPGARARSLSVGAGARFGKSAAVPRGPVKVHAESGICDPAEVSSLQPRRPLNRSPTSSLRLCEHARVCRCRRRRRRARQALTPRVLRLPETPTKFRLTTREYLLHLTKGCVWLVVSRAEALVSWFFFPSRTRPAVPPLNSS